MRSFIQSMSSHGALACGRNQLLWILTYHQVTPSMVDLLLTSNASSYSLTSAPFYYETLLNERQPHLRLPSLGRSGLRIQHCFNLLGIEKTSEMGKSALDCWKIQQIIAYHSFDLLSNQATWIIVKGNGLIKQRLSSTTKGFLERRPDYPQTRQACFLASLSSHLVITQWSAEGWDDYLDEIEKMSKKTYAIFPHAPFINRTTEKTTPDRYLSQGDRGPRSMFHDQLTLLASLEEKLHSAQTIVVRNREVVNQMKEYFDELTGSATLQSRMDLRPIGEDVSMFFRDFKLLYRRLGNQQERLKNLLWSLESRRAEVSCLKTLSPTVFLCSFSLDPSFYAGYRFN